MPELLFNPNDVVIDPEDGDIFVAESHRGGMNNRIVHYSSEGRFINQWGSKGSGQGELSEPHSIAMDSQGRFFVGDRENNRIQIFSQEGAFINEWTVRSPSYSMKESFPLHRSPNFYVLIRLLKNGFRAKVQ